MRTSSDAFAGLERQDLLSGSLHLSDTRRWTLIASTQLVTITILGMMGFMSSNFWLALLLQEVRNQDALDVAVCFLPQVIAGIIWNIVAANVLHWANNTVIVAGGAVAYVISSLLLALQGASSSYWAFMFPSLIISVIGADFQFNIANVGAVLL